MSNPLWGIDLGGTKIEGVILPSTNDVRPLIRVRVPTEASKGYEHVLDQIKVLVEEMKKQSGLSPEKIGVGTPGVLDPLTQTMKNCNTTSLNNKPLEKDLQAKLKLPVSLANDANCFALAETAWGVVKQKNLASRVVFGVIMGTGVGGGLVLDGRIWNGFHGIAGEWGHNFLDESGGPCYCGRTGCVETILSGPALERYYTRLTDQNMSLKQIAENYTNGKDEAAQQTMERLAYFFGKGIASVINVLDPDVIVIGGGVGNIRFLELAKPSLEKFIFNSRVDTPIVRPVLGDSAGVFGAAALTV
ncbi:MAG: ROK family protein [Chitinophagaceae bacterium]